MKKKILNKCADFQEDEADTEDEEESDEDREEYEEDEKFLNGMFEGSMHENRVHRDSKSNSLKII